MESLSNEMLLYDSERLQQLNDAFALELVWALTFVCVLAIVGSVGNVLVCFVYGLRLRMCTQHFLILTLTGFDLLTCFVTMPSQIADLRYYVSFEKEVACRALRFISVFTSTASSVVLVLIAVDRHTKICRPWSRMMSLRHTKMAVVLVVVVSCLVTTPVPVLAGIQVYNITDLNITVYMCSADGFAPETNYHFIYTTILFAGFLFLVVLLGVLYVRIWMAVKKQSRRVVRTVAETVSQPGPSSSWSPSAISTTTAAAPKPSTTFETTPCPSSSPAAAAVAESTTTTAAVVAKPSTTVETTPCPSSSPAAAAAAESTTTTTAAATATCTTTTAAAAPKLSTTIETTPCPSPSSLSTAARTGVSTTLTTVAPSPPAPKLDKKASRTTKTTLIAVLITVVFFLSFVPYFVFTIVTDLDSKLRGDKVLLYNIFVRFPFFNAVINPFIYGALNPRFRRECFKLFTWIPFCTCSKDAMESENTNDALSSQTGWTSSAGPHTGGAVLA